MASRTPGELLDIRASEVIAPIDSSFGTDLGDRAFWARQITADRRLGGRRGGQMVDLEEMIEDIKFKDTIKGSSTITVSIVDPNWSLTDQGFWDARADGRLDPLDVNYPDGSRFWWRLTQVGLDSEARSPKVTLTFMERAAAHLMAHKGPVKVSRGKSTRAQFIWALAARVKAGGGIRVLSLELTKKQPKAKAK